MNGNTHGDEPLQRTGEGCEPVRDPMRTHPGALRLNQTLD